MNYRVILMLLSIGSSALAQTDDPALKVSKLNAFFAFHFGGIADRLVSRNLDYEYDADNHILNGSGMFDVDNGGGNYVSFGNNRGEVTNVDYNTSGSFEGMIWENLKSHPFVHSVYFSNANDTSVNQFYIKVNGTTSIPPETEVDEQEIPNALIDPLFTCFLNTHVATIILNDTVDITHAFVLLTNEPMIPPPTITQATTLTGNNYEILYTVSVQSGTEISGIMMFTLLSEIAKSRLPPGPDLPPVDIVQAVGSMAAALPFPCSLITGQSDPNCDKGFPAFNRADFSPIGCQCLDGWTGPTCSTEDQSGGGGGGGGGIAVECP